MSESFQRKGGKSNAQVGRELENAALDFFKLSEGLELQTEKVPIGIGRYKKDHGFDLVCKKKKVIVECKSHKWTETGNIPSAKITTWNEAMYYFHCAPKGYRKIMFVLRDYSEKRQETLAEYYLRLKNHLIPSDVEFWEYDEKKGSAKRLC